MINPQFPIARQEGLVVQEVPNEVLVFDLNSNKAHCLNETAAFVWKSCDGKNSVSDIAGLLRSTTGNEVTDDLVWLAIDQLQTNDLIEAKTEPVFNGRSRRDAIKKIGLASMIALPIVASLAAPKNAMASVSCVCNTLPSECDPVCPQAACISNFCF